MNIEIEKPCHENWNRMTPNEKGAFCLTCQKTVIDFTKKTVEEIKEFFNQLPSAEKVCGRFAEKQLSALNFEEFFGRFRNWRLTKKLALVFFFGFGLGLFGQSQTTPNKQDHQVKGEVAYVAPKDTVSKPHKKESVNTSKGKAKEAVRKEKQKSNMIMGKPACRPDVERKD